MPTIPELLRDHVSLDIECVDRVYLNGYVPTLQTSGALVYFLERHRGNPIASPALLGKITPSRLSTKWKPLPQANHIPVVHFSRGQRKDDVAAQYRRKFIELGGRRVYWCSARATVRLQGEKGKAGQASVVSVFASTGVCQDVLPLRSRCRVWARLYQNWHLRAVSDQGVSEWSRVGQAAIASRQALPLKLWTMGS